MFFFFFLASIQADRPPHSIYMVGIGSQKALCASGLGSIVPWPGSIHIALFAPAQIPLSYTFKHHFIQGLDRLTPLPPLSRDAPIKSVYTVYT